MNKWQHKVDKTEVKALQFVVGIDSQLVVDHIGHLLDFDFGTGEGEDVNSITLYSKHLGDIDVKPKDYIVVNSENEVTAVDECNFVENYKKVE